MEHKKDSHPRPDRLRKNWLNLNGQWAFSFEEPVFDKTIQVPFSWAAPLSGIGEDRKGTGWYQKHVCYEAGNDRLFLIIGAADYECEVFVNGTSLGIHTGGYAPVETDVTACWQSGENDIRIRVTDTDEPFQTYGKQGYGNIRGIWQTVYLERRPSLFIRSFQICTELNGTVHIHVETAGKGSRTALSASFCGKTFSGNGSSITFQVPYPHLWSPDDPYLYQGELVLESENESGHHYDRVQTYFGLRTIDTDHFDGKTYITLNGKPLFLSGVLDQSYNPDGYFTLPTDEACRAEILQLKSAGFQFARIHIKGEEPLKLYWADKEGLLIMADMPCFWGEPTEQAKSLFEAQMLEALERDCNHPSIFYWVVFNETWGLKTDVPVADGSVEHQYLLETQEWVRACYQKVKAFDSTRLVEDNSPCLYDHVETDVNTWHFYTNGYASVRDRLSKEIPQLHEGSSFNFTQGNQCGDVPIMNSECGNYWGVQGGAGDSDLSWHYHYMINEFRLHEPLCGFVFTEFHDVTNEFNGFWRIDNSPKDFGYEGLVPGMTVGDLHSQSFLCYDCPPMQTVSAGQELSVPVSLSTFSEELLHAPASYFYQLFCTDETGKSWIETSGTAPVSATRYGTTPLGTLKVTMPRKNALAVLRLSLLAPDGTIVMRNFVTFDVIGEIKAQIPLSSVQSQGFPLTADCINGEKRNFIGEGTVFIPLNKSGYANGMIVAFEASSRPLFEKDETTAQSSGDLMLGACSPRGSNPNSFYMTDPALSPATVQVFAGGEYITAFTLPDCPADSRGCLSWHYQKDPTHLEEGGSYGYRCSVSLTREQLSKLPEQFDLALKVRGGLSLFGRKSGSLPMGITIYSENK